MSHSILKLPHLKGHFAKWETNEYGLETDNTNLPHFLKAMEKQAWMSYCLTSANSNVVPSTAEGTLLSHPH